MRRFDPSAAPISAAPSVLPLLENDAVRPIVWSRERTLSVREIAARVTALADTLPFKSHDRSAVPQSVAMINLCEDRSNFLIAYCAALSVGHITLLPSSRAPAVLSELKTAYAHSYSINDAEVRTAAVPTHAVLRDLDRLAADHVALVAFTSGSTGRSKSYPRTWASISTSTQLNARAIRTAIKLPSDGPMPWIVATVPPQHMYGMEFSVMLPMLDRMGVHSGRPLFPADIAGALRDVPAPRILVTTPIHLRALLESGIVLPPIAGVISATAPLDKALAKQVEQRYATTLFEMFGSTETCIFATRRSTHDDEWQPYPDVEITPRPDGVLVAAPWLAEPMLLQDIVEHLPNGNFLIRGRNTDFVDVAGKRASLAELTRRLLAVPGVEDAIVFPPEISTAGPARRVAALAVAPGLDAATVLERLSAGIDPAFLPRPLVLVSELPRNDTGKLPRDELLACLRKNTD